MVEGPVGALIAFSWTREGIKGEELQYGGLEEEVECTPYRSICPRCAPVKHWRRLGLGLPWVVLDLGRRQFARTSL